MTRLGVADDVAWTEGEDRVALLKLAGVDPRPVVLAGTAAQIWLLLPEAADEEELVARLAELYDVAPGDIRGEVRGFVADLVGRGYLTAGRA